MDVRLGNVCNFVNVKDDPQKGQSMSAEALHQIRVKIQFTGAFTSVSTVDCYRVLPSAEIQCGPRP